VFAIRHDASPLQEIFTHVEIKHGTLNQEDLEVIYATLRAVKSPSSDFSAQRKLTAAFIVSLPAPAEFDKTQHHINAIKDDPPGREEAVNIFICNHPLVANRTFVDLVATTHQQSSPALLPSVTPMPWRQPPSPLLLLQLSALEQQIDGKASEGPRRDS
jgi:hypothetical protein